MPKTATDWEAIQRRIERSTAAIKEGAERSPADVARILEARARAAATRPEKPDSSERIEVLAFSLAQESYGVEASYVREVCKLKDLTGIPCTPAFIAGVMNLRGLVIAIIDLRKFFGLPARGLTELNRVIVLKDGENMIGLLADSIDGLVQVAVDDLARGLPTLAGIRERFLMGVTGTMTAVLDGDRLLGDTSLKINEQITL